MNKEEIIKEFKQYLKSTSREFTKSTITGYSLDILNYLKWYEENPGKNLKQFLTYLRENNIDPKTANHHIFALKWFQDYLSESRYTKEVKIIGLNDELIYPTVDITYIHFAKSDIENFIAEVKKTNNKRYIALVIVMAKAGLKISEALQLKKENIDGNKIIVISEETGKHRVIKVSKEVISVINDYLEVQKSDSPYLFHSNKSERLDRTVVNRFFKKYYITPKQLRYYFIVQCLENDLDMSDISKYSGIKTLNWIFSRYNSMHVDQDKFNK